MVDLVLPTTFPVITSCMSRRSILALKVDMRVVVSRLSLFSYSYLLLSLGMVLTANTTNCYHQSWYLLYIYVGGGWITMYSKLDSLAKAILSRLFKTCNVTNGYLP